MGYPARGSGLDNSIYSARNNGVEAKLVALTEQRKIARHRRRRIIMNNDGNDFHNATPEEPKTPETFLSKRTTPLLGTHVDSIFYCTGVFNYYTHRSNESELFTDDSIATKYVHELIRHGTDSLEVMTNFCHDNDLEIFWSMRMNDTHDFQHDRLMCQWKRDNPELLVATPDERISYGCKRWSALDYAKLEVRQKVLRILTDVATRYDVDGIELDFCRHPVFFKPQMTGRKVYGKYIAMMTDLLRQIRRVLDAVAVRRSRPFLLAIRVPDSIGYCKAIGLDLVAWLQEGWVDLISSCDYFKLEPWETLVELGHSYNVPVYACLEARRILHGQKKDPVTSLKIWRGEAYNAWQGGVDGIYTFNQFVPQAPVFRELGDPQLLETLDRIDQTTYIANTGARPNRWVKNGESWAKPARISVKGNVSGDENGEIYSI